MSFECAHCHDYVAGVGVDPPQFCNMCQGMKPACGTCETEFDWNEGPDCGCSLVHGEVHFGEEES